MPFIQMTQGPSQGGQLLAYCQFGNQFIEASHLLDQLVFYLF